MPTDGSKTKDDTPPEVSLNTVGSQAAAYVAEDDFEGAFEHYDKQIEAAQDNRQKKSLLVKKSLLARDIGEYDVAIASAKQADEIDSDTQTMRALADAYAANGDKEQALTYYRKLLVFEKVEGDGEGAMQGMQLGPSVETIIKELEK